MSHIRAATLLHALKWLTRRPLNCSFSYSASWACHFLHSSGKRTPLDVATLEMCRHPVQLLIQAVVWFLCFKLLHLCTYWANLILSQLCIEVIFSFENILGKTSFCNICRTLYDYCENPPMRLIINLQNMLKRISTLMFDTQEKKVCVVKIHCDQREHV